MRSCGSESVAGNGAEITGDQLEPRQTQIYKSFCVWISIKGCGSSFVLMRLCVCYVTFCVSFFLFNLAFLVLFMAPWAQRSLLPFLDFILFSLVLYIIFFLSLISEAVFKKLFKEILFLRFEETQRLGILGTNDQRWVDDFFCGILGAIPLDKEHFCVAEQSNRKTEGEREAWTFFLGWGDE